MKKLTAILLALLLALSLTACEDAISKLLYKNDAKDPDVVQPKEPDIPGTTPSGGSAAPTEPTTPAEPAAPVEPAVPEPGEVEAPDNGPEADDPETDIRASHADVTLFSAGETFTLSARGVSGTYAASFSSKDPAVATVDETTGVVTAVAPGITTVTMHMECEAGQFDFDCIIRCRWEAEEPGLPDAGSGTDQQPGSSPEPPAGTASAASLSGFYSTLQGQYEGLGRMMAIDGDLLENYYPGLSGIASVEEVLIQETAITTANVAVGLVRLSEDAPLEDVLAVQSVLQGRISAQANGGAWYPASCETWKQGVITSVSNCVGMFVYPEDAQSMADAFVSAFSN